ncbi:photosystem II reaction center protein Psb28 [Anthocerotibacter panamensis]|uniref:photosystem II reaction center protein Psb28 n=1 Tax=Anthocerotibacter panamensis TaxID=2857077 RepID=UPI001C406FF0|nr:photosystem II reaction center protein Psb28 [Anthocerotibacter panamensis]
MAISVQFIQGLEEQISEISLRKARTTATRIVVLTFERLQAMERLRSFTQGSDSLWLEDEEGEIQVFPSGMKFFFRNDDDLAKVECTFEVTSEEVFERVMRFLNRWAEANGFQYNARKS